jgi:hypothetical protein
MTVRRDIAAAPSGLACLGGYVMRNEAPGGVPRYALDAEQVANIQMKQDVARRAAALVKRGDTLFIDCGTTTPHLAEALPPGELTVVCYSLNIASIVCTRVNTQVLLLGGLYYPASATFFGEATVAQLERIAITKAFISAGGVDPNRGRPLAVSADWLHFGAADNPLDRVIARNSLGGTCVRGRGGAPAVRPRQRWRADRSRPPTAVKGARSCRSRRSSTTRRTWFRS